MMGLVVSSRRRKVSRPTSLFVYIALLFVTVAFDMSVYVGGLFHLYTHDVTSLAIGVFGLALARKRQTLLPTSRPLWAALTLLAFLLANTVISGAIQYGDVPTEMRRLFWFEHGNALRIVGELLVWVWTLGLLAPTRQDATAILDSGLWGATCSVALLGAFWASTNTIHVGTTTFDLNVMIGLPMAMMFVMARGRRLDLLRLAVFAAASLFLYSRSAMLAVFFTTLVLLIVIHRPRAVGTSLACIAAGWILVLALATAATELKTSISASPATSSPSTSPRAPTPSPLTPDTTASPTAPAPPIAITQPGLDHTVSRPVDAVAPGQPAVERAASIVRPDTASYTIPNRLAIWYDAIRIFQISPVVGVGYHNYFAYSRVTEVKDASRFDVPGLFSSLIKQAHNDFLSWLAETGVLGFALYISFWGFVLFEAARLWRAEPATRERHTFTIAFMLSLLGISALGEMLVPRMPSWIASALLWWVLIGLLFIDAGRQRESQRRVNL
jgi:hypothetical protein